MPELMDTHVIKKDIDVLPVDIGAVHVFCGKFSSLTFRKKSVSECLYKIRSEF